MEVRSDGLDITIDATGRKYFWYYEKICITDPPHDGIAARLTYADLPHSQLIVPDALFYPLKPRLPKQPVNYRLIGMIMSFIILVVVATFWLIPVAAPMIAKTIPTSWERRLSNMAFKQLVDDQQICQDERINQIMADMANKLTKDQTIPPVKISIVRSGTVNAFALPASHIVIHSQLIANAESPEELAGILAHEMGHVAHHHVMENVVRHLGITGLIDVATGGGGTMVYLTMALYNSSYSRDKEHEADVFAARLMTMQGYSLDGMVAFFERMNKTDSNPTIGGVDLDIDSLQWLSTHPADRERIAFFQQYPNAAQQSAIINSAEWEELQALKGCFFRQRPAKKP